MYRDQVLEPSTLHEMCLCSQWREDGVDSGRGTELVGHKSRSVHHVNPRSGKKVVSRTIFRDGSSI